MDAGTSELERRVDDIIAQHVNPRGPGLSVLIGRDKEVLLAKGYGLADVDAGIPITPASRFVIGSVTKQFTCMAVMMLKHEGKLSYEDPVAKHLPQMKLWGGRVTLRQLMNHTSGVPEYLTEEFWRAAVEGQYPDLDSVLDLIAGLGDLEFEPGSRWRYCNSGYIMLGAIVAKVSGMSFAAFLKERVFDRLGMAGTFVGETADRALRLAVGYDYKSYAAFEPAPWCFPVIGWADGNIISCSADLFRWGQALYTDELLPYHELAEAFRPCNPADPAFSRYGFGHTVSERRGAREIHHAGSTLGYVTWFTRFTDHRLTVVLLSNAAGIKLAEISGAIAEILLEGKMAPAAVVCLPEAQLDEKVGAYAGSPRGRALRVTVASRDTPAAGSSDASDCSTVAGDSAVLVAEIQPEGGQAERYLLRPLSRDLFLANLTTDTYFTFTWADGAVSGVRVAAAGGVQSFARRGSPGNRG